jgi:hypothetical protein
MMKQTNHLKRIMRRTRSICPSPRPSTFVNIIGGTSFGDSSSDFGIVNIPSSIRGTMYYPPERKRQYYYSTVANNNSTVVHKSNYYNNNCQSYYRINQHCSIHFATSEYASCFVNLPNVTPSRIESIRQCAIDYIHNFDPNVWYEQPVRMYAT